jgi:membrane dipeptidase
MWPVDDYKASKQATDSIAWTNWPLFTVGRVMRGHGDEVIRKVIGGNVMRVARESMPE